MRHEMDTGNSGVTQTQPQNSKSSRRNAKQRYEITSDDL